MDNWEYMVLVLPSTLNIIGQKDRTQTELLNILGKEGWELISVICQIVKNDNCQKAYLRRRK
jgi:hypothetical protein